MAITKQTVADKLAAYLRHDISLTELVSWAEKTMMDGEFAENDMEAVTGVRPERRARPGTNRQLVTQISADINHENSACAYWAHSSLSFVVKPG